MFNCRVLAQRRFTATKALDSDRKIALVIAFHICFMQCKNMLAQSAFIEVYSVEKEQKNLKNSCSIYRIKSRNGHIAEASIIGGGTV